MATVVVLNGTSSVGKTSAARAFQRLACAPYLHVQMDAFMAMMPERIWTDPDGIAFRQGMVDGQPEVDIATGPAFARVMQGMRQSVGALAQAGNNCIVDDVMLQPGDQQAYRDCLGASTLFFVALRAPLAVTEARESARGDRVPGLARGQVERVHAGRTYDFEIETSDLPPDAVATAIADALGIPYRRDSNEGLAPAKPD